MLTLLSLLGLGAIGGTVSGSAPAGAAEVPRDGLTAETAAPSCWSIKQAQSASPDGIYWLWTPKLVEPQQFYCDMTTDGGGWVLVGRGREGWSFQYWGQGSPSTVRTTITGPDAFTPATLSTPVVDGLMNGGRMDGLADGIRLRRATNTTGTTWQEVRMRVKTYGKWSWAFGGGIYLSSVRFDSTTTNLGTSTYRTNTTANVQVANDARRVFTYPLATHDLRAGFSFGSGITNGTNSATSYLWEFANENSAIPFTQVFIRPTISAADILAEGVSVAPAAGLPASTVKPMLDHRPTAQPWATTGINDGTAIPDLNANVTAFADIGNTIYIGGKFLQLQRGPGTAPVTQSYLAAFDKTTGERIPTFNPVLDAPVWELKAAPDGTKLFVGGEFTSVNGQADTSGLAALDPTTGAPVTSWVGYVARTTGAADVRTLDVQSGFLYVGGQFNRVAGGIGTQFLGPIVVGRLARFRLTDGRPDGAWKPNVETAPQDLDASPQGDRVYVVGLFQTLNEVNLNPAKLAVIGAATAEAVPGLEPWQPNASSSEWSNAILEVGDKVYQGGTQHILHQYARGNYGFERSHMTRTGGDYQAIAYRDGILYAACHCNDWQYQDTNSQTDPFGYSQVNPINMIGAYDTTDDLEVLPEFHTTQLDLTGADGEGPWELFVDSDNCMWAGGDLVRPGTTPTPFYGGYERFCGRDSTAPTTPPNAHTTLAGNDVTIGWNASTDNATTPIRYEILKDDPTFGTIVMGSTFERTFTDTNVVDPSRYFVRAADAEGNRSATTAVLAVTPPPPAAATLLAGGATWSYRADGQDLGSAWRQTTFNSSSWSTGAAQLGWGGKGETTVIPSGPVTSYFVRHQNIANPSQYGTVTVRLKRDDGALVYVNGVPVVRDNMPTGPVTASTLASSFTSGTSESTWFERQIPASLFRNGDNTIAVEVHQADLNNADAVFDLELVARNSSETTAPTVPTPAVDDVGPDRVALSWSPSSDNAAVIGYLVRRNGTSVGFTAGTSFTDTELDAATSYSYQVLAIDSSGNASSPGAVAALTTANPFLVQSGAVWSYRSTATDPGTAWRQPGFNASSWSSGPSQLGWGNRGEATLVPSGTRAQYYLRHINVGNPAELGALTLRFKRDDGIAVYVNGTEVVRDNLPAGTLTATTLASTMVSAADGIAWKTTTIPSDALVAGDNVIAAEVHQDSQTDARAVFDLELQQSLDATKPVTTDNTASIGSAWKRTAQTVTLAPTDAGGSGVAATYFTTDGSTPTTASAQGTSVVLSAPGAYTVKYFSVDGAGNVEAVKTAGTQIRIDTVAPTYAITFPVNAGRYNTARWNAGCSATQYICGTAADTGSGIASVKMTIRRSNDSQYWTGSTWRTASATIIATGTTSWRVPLPASQLTHAVTYTVTAWSVDGAGRASPPTITTFTYDTAGPTTTGAKLVTTNKNGAISANIDKLSVTFNEPLRPANVPTTATLTISRSNGQTSYGISGLTDGLRTTGSTGYLASSSTRRNVRFTGTLALSNGNKTVTFTVTGACTGSCTARTTSPLPGAFQFKPATTLRDRALNPPATTTVTAPSQVMF